MNKDSGHVTLSDVNTEATYRHSTAKESPTANAAKRVDRKVHHASGEASLLCAETRGAAGEHAVVHPDTEVVSGDVVENTAAFDRDETPQCSVPLSPLSIETSIERELGDSALDAAPSIAPSTVAMSVVNSQNHTTEGRFSPLVKNDCRRPDDEPSMSQHAPVVQLSGGGLQQITVDDVSSSAQPIRESGSKAKRAQLRENAVSTVLSAPDDQLCLSACPFCSSARSSRYLGESSWPVGDWPRLSGSLALRSGRHCVSDASWCRAGRP